MCDSIGGCMKKLVSRVVLALFVANVACTSMTVEASWLSKQLDNLFGTGETVQTEADRQRAEEMRDLPKHTDAEYEKLRKPPHINGFGKPLPKSEFTVAGVPMGAHVNDIIKSLGKPTSEDIKYKRKYMSNGWVQIPLYHLEYGGLSFDTHVMPWDHDVRAAELIDLTTIHNRDAATARGITVGDTLKQVYNAYGRPTFITRKNEWFYGVTYPDDYVGIWFVSDGYKVTKIKLGGASFEYGRYKDTF